MVVVGDCWDGSGGDGGWGWEAADVACTSYACVGVGRLGWGLRRVNEVEHGARHCALLVVGGWDLDGGDNIYVCVYCVLYRREREIWRVDR